MTNLQIGFTTCIGLITGSFLLALCDRSLNTKYKGRVIALLTQPSHCDHCLKPIPFYFNIPCVGFLLTRGLCTFCRQRISIRYPASELCSLLIALFSLYRFGFTFEGLLFFITSSVAMAALYCDLKSMIIPNSLHIILIIAIITSILIQGFALDSLYGLLITGAFFLLILLIFPGSFGGGDLKLAALLGYFTGFQFCLIMIEISLITGTLCGITYAIISKKGLKIKIPFAPFIVTGYLVAQLYGTEIIFLYHQLLY